MPLFSNARRTTQPKTAGLVSGPLAHGIVFAGAPSVSSGMLVDFSGNNLHGVPTNAPGRIAQSTGIASTHTTASAQRFSLGNSPLMNGQGALSLLFYWSPDSGLTDYSLFSRDDNSLGRAWTLDSIFTGGANRHRFYVNGGGAAGTNSLSDGTGRTTGELLLVIATFNDATNTATLWVNGVQKNSSTSFSGVPAASTGAVLIGGRTYTGAEDYMGGNVYLAVMWNRALIEGEVRALSNNPWQIFAGVGANWWLGPPAAVGGSFNAAWNIAANTVVQNGAIAA